MAFEVPACCQYMGWMVTISNWVEEHFKFWMRGCLYFGLVEYTEFVYVAMWNRRCL